MDLNHWTLNPGLVRAFCENAGPTLEWLIGLGVDIPARESSNAHMPGLCQAGVEDVWRGHVPKDQATDSSRPSTVHVAHTVSKRSSARGCSD